MTHSRDAQPITSRHPSSGYLISTRLSQAFGSLSDAEAERCRRRRGADGHPCINDVICPDRLATSHRSSKPSARERPSTEPTCARISTPWARCIPRKAAVIVSGALASELRLRLHLVLPRQQKNTSGAFCEWKPETPRHTCRLLAKLRGRRTDDDGETRFVCNAGRRTNL